MSHDQVCLLLFSVHSSGRPLPPSSSSLLPPAPPPPAPLHSAPPTIRECQVPLLDSSSSHTMLEPHPEDQISNSYLLRAQPPTGKPLPLISHWLTPPSSSYSFTVFCIISGLSAKKIIVCPNYATKWAIKSIRAFFMRNVILVLCYIVNGCWISSISHWTWIIGVLFGFRHTAGKMCFFFPPFLDLLLEYSVTFASCYNGYNNIYGHSNSAIVKSA